MMDIKFDLLLSQLRRNPLLAENVASWQDIPARKQETFTFPDWIKDELVQSFKDQGITGLYSHQMEVLELVHQKKDLVITTGTASGKSFCYQIPILNQILQDGHSTALLFFPTKALTYDQLKSILKLSNGTKLSEIPYLTAVYDGDTPSTQRTHIRQKAKILLTNPDMLNMGILPHHSNWAHFFENLQYVVIDEVHLYRGVFGSHIANLIRRLNRIIRFYGATPQYIMASATIANPCELAQKLVDREISEVSSDSSPRGEKQFIIYNPPLVDQELGIREGMLFSLTKLSTLLLSHDIQSLVFCRTRRFVELLLREIRQVNPQYSKRIRGYRSGYLKNDRREIESGLKDGSINMAVTTNALELGVDIGGVDAVLMAGYPGSICSLRQRIGRSGRSLHPSLSVLVTSMNPLDQFFARNPNYLLDRPLEMALINPDNPLILLPHIRSAVFELPFEEGDYFGNLRWEELMEYLDYLVDEAVLQKRRNKYFWLSDSYPANDFSLRSTVASQVLIQYQDIETKEIETIGEIDYDSALWMVHPGAVYLQDGLAFVVTDLDLNNNVATLTDHHGDFITEPIIFQEIEPISSMMKTETTYYSMHYGEVEVSSQVTGYKKMQNLTRIILSIETLDLPLEKMQTTGFWMELNPDCIKKMREESLWLSDTNDYGKDWKKISQSVRRRDEFKCQSCGRREEVMAFHVHHKIPFKSFSSINNANKLDNLVTLCPNCHRLAELNIRMRNALSGLKYLMTNLAPLLVLCEPTDLGAFVDSKAKFAEANPVVLLYDAIPAGIGLCSSLYDRINDLLEKCLQVASTCDCQNGCPSCVGPVSEIGFGGKNETVYLLNLLKNRAA